MAAPRSSNRSEEATQQLDGGTDGIFRLPDDILKHFFFYLPLEDSLSLSATSRTWRSIYNSLPVFEFKFDIHEEDGSIDLKDLLTSIKRSSPTLRNHRAIISNFCLNMDLSEEKGLKLIKSHLDDWLSLISKNHVKAIHIGVSNNSSSENNIYFNLPQAVFTSRSLVKLYLKGCKFPTNISLYGNNGVNDDNDGRNSGFHEFYYLKEISLVNVVASNDQIHELINLARNSLENLLIQVSRPMEFLGIQYFPKLDSIEANVRILFVKEAMKLDKVTLSGLKRAYLSRVDNIRTLKCVKWFNNALRSLEALIVKSLPFLETLHLIMFRNQRIRILSRHLKTLLLQQCRRFEQPLVVVLFTPQLSKICFNGFCIPIIKVDGKNQKLVCNHFGDPSGGAVHGSHLHKLGKFSKNLRQSMVKIHLPQILMIDENGENVVKTLEELRAGGDVPCPSNVKMLVLEGIPAALDYTSFLDALFWTCHPRTLYVMLTTKETLESPHRAPFISYLENELSLRREKNPRCCNEPNKPKCWRHYVEQVKFNVYSNSMLKQFGDEEQLDLLSDHDISDDVDEDTSNKEEKLVVEFKIVWKPYPYHFGDRYPVIRRGMAIQY